VHEQDLPELMTAYQRGNLEAFERLYWGLRPRLHQYLCVLTRNRTRAEDLLQETFLQIHRSRSTYGPGRAVLPWAMAIARHVYLMEVRTRTRILRREVAMDDPPELPVPPEAEALADRRRLQQAMAALPADQREAIILHYVWGYTFEEIGATLGVRGVTAKVRAFRGIRRLKQLLAADT
jgi:RNA polymerase sigma-70 factor, ECF subfamily